MTEDSDPGVVPLATEETEARGFDVVLRGYDRTQVDRHVAWLESLLGTAEDQHATAEAELTTLREEVAALRSRAAEWERDRPSYESLGERIGQMLALAEQEAEAIKVTARDEVAGLQNRIDRENSEAIARRDREDRAATQAREEETARVRAECERTLAEARAQAAEVVEVANREVDKLTAQRDAIHDQLAKLQERLAAAMGLVGASEPEAAEGTVVLPGETADSGGHHRRQL